MRDFVSTLDRILEPSIFEEGWLLELGVVNGTFELLLEAPEGTPSIDAAKNKRIWGALRALASSAAGAARRKAIDWLTNAKDKLDRIPTSKLQQSAQGVARDIKAEVKPGEITDEPVAGPGEQPATKPEAAKPEVSQLRQALENFSTTLGILATRYPKSSDAVHRAVGQLSKINNLRDERQAYAVQQALNWTTKTAVPSLQARIQKLRGEFKDINEYIGQLKEASRQLNSVMNAELG